MFEPKKFSDIVEDMGGRITGLSDFYVGSVTRTLVETFSFELGLLYQKMERVYLSAFIDTAEGINLEQVVAVLGIKRGLPDYATGTVSFTRDAGKDNIIIPIGTLVSTEEGSGNTKKVYQTIEEKTLAPDMITLDVKVQAVERGEEYDAAEAEISVMPRPIPGVKSVTNKGKVRVTGKKRETDEELRERAKNTLISSGKATLLSIENTLLSMPGVSDVKVVEDYAFPQGTATLSLKGGEEKATIPRNSLILIKIGQKQEEMFQTKTEVFLSEKNQSPEVKIRSVREGRSGEIPAPSDPKFKDEGLNGLVSISIPKPVVLTDFGVIDVFVAGPNLADQKERARIQSAIDKVKAAGIYVRLYNAQAVTTDGIFRIDLGSRQSLDNDEIKEMETRVAETIRDFIRQIKMGNPLVFSRLLKEVITVEGVANLTDFRLFTEADRFSGQTIEYQLSANKIEIEESERFEPRDICVAASDKLLPVDVEIHIPGINKDNYKDVVESLKGYFDGLAQGDEVTNEGLIQKIQNGNIKPESKTLQLKPYPWCPRSTMLILKEEGGTKYASSINVSFVERATLGRFFAYSHFLDITGALYVTFKNGLTVDRTREILDALKIKIASFINDIVLESRGEQMEIKLETLSDVAGNITEVDTVEFNLKDFRTEVFDGINIISGSVGLNNNKITIGEFQKPRLKENSFLVTNKPEDCMVSVTATITLGSPPNDTVKTNLKNQITNSIINLIDNTAVGANLKFEDMRRLLDNPLPSVPSSLEKLVINADSVDGRKQIVSIIEPGDIHVRSVEKLRTITEKITIAFS
jgi:hypothetical protein